MILNKKRGIRIEIICETSHGKIIHEDNIKVLKTLEPESIDNCISDFPYDLSFMGKKWDTTGNFYEWNKSRAEGLYRVLKCGGYVAIFGHPKTNHRMKCAFEDIGFKIVEEIDWVYLTGMPKNQDIGKLFDKAEGIKRPLSLTQRPIGGKNGIYTGQGGNWGETINIPLSDLAKKWNGWKTSGLKPAHEPITIFQKPLDGKYINNIEKHGCGAMNIDACRVPISQEDINMLNAKASKNPTTNYSDKDNKIYGAYAEDKAMPPNELGRFPANLILDEGMAIILDEQTGITESKKGKPRTAKVKNSIPFLNSKEVQVNCEYNDIGGGSRLFTVIKYNQKTSNKEKTLPNGEKNPHVTPKPVELIKWLVKLLTPINGITIDICAGSCTHAVACEELNANDGYKLKYLNIEMMNTEEEPFCDVGKMRVEQYI